jgi:hypothetical protein
VFHFFYKSLIKDIKIENNLIIKIFIYYFYNIVLLLITYYLITKINLSLINHDQLLGEISYIYTNLLSSIAAIIYIDYIYYNEYNFIKKEPINYSLVFLHFILLMFSIHIFLIYGIFNNYH